MRPTSKALIVGLVSSITFALGAAPAVADAPIEDFSAPAAAAVVPAAAITQSLDTTLTSEELAGQPIDSVLTLADSVSVPHNFDVEAAVALAEAEIGTSRPTGWSQPGECIMSAQRWIVAGGGAWTGGGTPVSNYDNATRLTLADAKRGDVIQYEYMASPTSWVTGVHTVLVTGVNADGTLTIIQSNSPGGSGLVTKAENWTPDLPSGFQAVVWRF